MAQRMVMVDGDYFDLPWGRVEFHNNEIHIVTGVNDASGLSFRGATNCKVSWKDASGREKALLIMRENAKGDGEFYLGGFSQARYDEMLARGGAWADKALDLAMVEMATMNPDGCELRVPLRASAGFVGAAAINGVTDTMWAPTGLFFTQQQIDGNFVTYRVDVPFDKTANPVALWSAFGGFIAAAGV